MEIAIFDAHIDVRIQGIARACYDLPGNAAILEIIVEGRIDIIKIKFAPGKADARSDIEAETVLIAQVEQQVGHDRGIAGRPINIGRTDIRTAFPVRENEINLVDADMLVAKIKFGPDNSGVVAENEADIVAHLVINLEEVIER